MKIPEITIARYYVYKHKNATNRGLEFTLTFNDIRRLLSTKRCKYTGIELTKPEGNGTPKPTDRTLERIDNTKGYVTGNVVAVCHAANQLKSVWEDENSPLTFENIKSMIKYIGEHNES